VKKVPVAIYRGGTSRALFFHKRDLPDDVSEQDEIILQAIGSGHQLQVNGLGGGNPLTSKCAIIGPPSVPGADVDYTFVYPGVTKMIVDRKGNCGNISAAVGPFSVNEGLVKASGDQAAVVIYNTNTKARLRAIFPVKNGRFDPAGDYVIDGAPGTGSRISLEFLGDPTQSMLPTGDVREKLAVPGFSREVDVSIVQAGNLAVFCTMDALGITGNPADWENDEDLWGRMEAVRGAAAVRLKMAETLEDAKRNTPAVPKIIALRSPRAYVDLQGRQQTQESHQLMILTAAMGVMHRSMAVTGAIATAAAAVLPGSVVNEIRGDNGADVVIGHPSGSISLTAELIRDRGIWMTKKIALNRTAREILKGEVFIER
jgi:hypothetical protein